MKNKIRLVYIFDKYVGIKGISCTFLEEQVCTRKDGKTKYHTYEYTETSQGWGANEILIDWDEKFSNDSIKISLNELRQIQQRKKQSLSIGSDFITETHAVCKTDESLFDTELPVVAQGLRDGTGKYYKLHYMRAILSPEYPNELIVRLVTETGIRVDFMYTLE
jgi:hypothetical protein